MAVGKIAKSPLHIIQASGLSISQIKAVARRLAQQHSIKLFVIDHAQKVKGIGDNMEQRTASVSAGSKEIAMEHNVPVILCSQRNKEGMTKHASAITEDTDSLWVIENDGEWQSQVQPVDLNVEKCRDGETGQVKLTFMKTFTKFENAAKVSDEDVPNR